MALRRRLMARTFRFRKEDFRVSQLKASLVVASDTGLPRMNRRRMVERRRAGRARIPSADRHPICVNNAMVITGVKAKAREGMDWLSPSMRPFVESSVLAETIDAPTGCWGLLLIPPKMVKPRNWRKP